MKIKELARIVEKTMKGYDKTPIKEIIVEKLGYHLIASDLDVETREEFQELLFKIADVIEIEFNWGELEL